MTKRKGFSGPRSKNFRDEPGPIQLPDLIVEELDDDSEQNETDLVDYRTTHRGVVDQTLLRRLKCTRCYGTGRVPSAQFCGAGKACPSCAGVGEIDPAPIKRPGTPIGPGSTREASKASELLSYDRDFKPRQAIDEPQQVLPGDVDYDDETEPDGIRHADQ
jgi:hypothetical protein